MKIQPGTVAHIATTPVVREAVVVRASPSCLSVAPILPSGKPSDDWLVYTLREFHASCNRGVGFVYRTAWVLIGQPDNGPSLEFP